MGAIGIENQYFPTKPPREPLSIVVAVLIPVELISPL
jgi:hypothetical protein